MKVLRVSPPPEPLLFGIHSSIFFYVRAYGWMDGWILFLKNKWNHRLYTLLRTAFFTQ